MTQLERVLAASRRYNGVCQVDFALPGVCDDGPPITRVAARLQDLEDRGYTFECIGWRHKTKVFRLLTAPESSRLLSERGVCDPVIHRLRDGHPPDHTGAPLAEESTTGAADGGRGLKEREASGVSPPATPSQPASAVSEPQRLFEPAPQPHWKDAA